jgi:HEPN domain-containing protein
MISRNELRKIARSRLKDAENLYKNGRYDGAIYLCGYAVEAALKARICRTLKWDGFPSTRGEFQSYQSFRTHDLKVLLSLSGVEEKILTEYPMEWKKVSIWSPEMRYQPIGTTRQIDLLKMIEATKMLVKVL